MVKLRSRLIRSPFTGAAAAVTGGDSTSPGNNGINFHPSNQGRGIGRPNNHSRQQSQRQRQVNRRRNRGNMSASNSEISLAASSSSSAASSVAAGAAAASTTSRSSFNQRRPYDSPAAGPLRSVVASPNKRKPESRGITASIRRAKTAMLRLASSPSRGHASQQQPLGELARASSNVPPDDDEDDDERMDTSDDDEAGVVRGETILAVGARRRAPSQEENVPPLALLSPDCGTAHAHAAAGCANNYKSDVDDCGPKGGLQREGPNAMDVDRAAAPPTAGAARAAPRAKNVLEWMGEDAPPELLPRLLSFCGSRRMRALSRVNRGWNAVMKDEAVWRVVCEDTRKVRRARVCVRIIKAVGDFECFGAHIETCFLLANTQWSNGDEVPKSWSKFYRQNPVVPIDYDTVDAAFGAVSSGPLTESRENNVTHSFREQRETCRVLLHPGPYFLRRPLVANVAGGAEVTIAILDGGGDAARDPEHGAIWQQNYHKEPYEPPATEESDEESDDDDDESSLLATPRTAREHFASLDGSGRVPSTPTLRQIFGSCAGRSSSAAALAGLDRHSSHSSSSGSGGSSYGSDYEEARERSKMYRAAFRQRCFRGPRPMALLCLESRRHNEPVVRVRRGTVNLVGLKFLHYCEGTDIWNGNAAVQVQAAFDGNGRPVRYRPPMVPPTANVTDCDVTSLSGRGIVSIDGGVSRVRDCHIHDSAATGVYVGGSGSLAVLERTDVVENGAGNARTSRGVARGHSGVYVEQGLAKLTDCNVSRNSLTGISAISTEQARLHVEGSDIRANRSDQMELPPPDSGRGVSRNNRVSSAGQGRPRSRHLMDSVAVLEQQHAARTHRMPSTPQSPL